MTRRAVSIWPHYDSRRRALGRAGAAAARAAHPPERRGVFLPLPQLLRHLRVLRHLRLQRRRLRLAVRLQRRRVRQLPPQQAQLLVQRALLLLRAAS